MNLFVPGVKSEPKAVFLEPKPVPHLQHLHNHCNNDVNSNVTMDNNNSMPPEVNRQHPDPEETKDPLCENQTATPMNETHSNVDFYP